MHSPMCTALVIYLCLYIYFCITNLLYSIFTLHSQRCVLRPNVRVYMCLRVCLSMWGSVFTRHYMCAYMYLSNVSDGIVYIRIHTYAYQPVGVALWSPHLRQVAIISSVVVEKIGHNEVQKAINTQIPPPAGTARLRLIPILDPDVKMSLL